MTSRSQGEGGQGFSDCSTKEAIEITRDTLRGGQQNATRTFFAFLKILIRLEVKGHARGQKLRDVIYGRVSESNPFRELFKFDFPALSLTKVFCDAGLGRRSR